MSLPGLQRKPIYAPRGVVATSQPLAASAGLAALRRGGNAIDAALAAAITHTIVSPGANDIGGDLFAVVWDGQRLFGLNASGRSPARLRREHVGDAIPARGWLPVTVAGAPAGWRDLHARFGRLPFVRAFDEAIALAENGFPVSPTVAHQWRQAVAVQARLTGPEFAGWARTFTIGGRAPEAGERFRNPDAARTLRLIANTDAAAFYTGEIADALVAQSQRTGGFLDHADLAGHANRWDDPVSVSYHGHEVWELPPNGQGLAALIALSILDGVDLAGATPERVVHTQVEAIKLGFADARAVVADPQLSPAPIAQLLHPEYIASRRGMLGETAATPAPGPPARGGTVYLCSADESGLMVSLIQSTYQGFGSFVVVPGYGFGLQNRGAGFSLDPGHPNVVGPAKRPYHTIIPGFLTRQGEPVGPFGVMGGHMQPQGHVQLVTTTVDQWHDPQAVLDAPRWYWSHDRLLWLEPEWGSTLIADLRRRGHDVSVISDRGMVGQGQAIWCARTWPAGRSSERAGYIAGSEPRADGLAAAF